MARQIGASRHFNRRHMSFFSAGDTLDRFRWIINTTFEQISSQMVVLRAIECTALPGNWELITSEALIACSFILRRTSSGATFKKWKTSQRGFF
jgi:hypothetical protein